MFTGIIETISTILDIKEKKNFRTQYICLPKTMLSNLNIGDSISNNGCCLTITKINNNIVSFDIIKETLRLTNLGQLKIGDKVNLERSASLQKEIGGHLMSGHIMCTAKLVKINISENNKQVWFSLCKDNLLKYIFNKGYIGIDGISLTIGKIKNNCFCVNLIPETITRTTLGEKKIQDIVNIEIDLQTKVIVDSLERILFSNKLSLILNKI